MKCLALPAVMICCALACLTACSKSNQPPPPLSLQELPGALQQAFAKGKPAAQQALQPVLLALQTNGYASALAGLQNLSGVPGLTRKQANVAAAGLVTVNNALQEAQSQGDQEAAQALQFFRKNK